jgi:hypothetical protein
MIGCSSPSVIDTAEAWRQRLKHHHQNKGTISISAVSNGSPHVIESQPPYNYSIVTQSETYPTKDKAPLSVFASKLQLANESL